MSRAILSRSDYASRTNSNHTISIFFSERKVSIINNLRSLIAIK